MIIDKNLCSGCSACKSICPVDAITMEKDDEGFLYPYIKKELCINCNKCKKVCPAETDKVFEVKTEEFFAGVNKDNAVVSESSSGGMFSAISDLVLKKSGVVYGAEFDKDFNVIHNRAETKKQRDNFLGSKYVESNVLNTFRNIKKDLVNGKIVLFSGTPCQNSGLKSYITAEKINTKNLILCDVACHGNASPEIWESYLAFVKNKYRDDICNVNFRYKKFGWNKTCLRIKGNSFEQVLDMKHDPYYILYFKNSILRPSCYSCKYASYRRVSDFTLADFWGIEKISGIYKKNNGVSLLLCNTEKGKRIINQLDNVLINKMSLDGYICPMLEHSVSCPENRNDVWNSFKNDSFETFSSKFAKLTLREKIIKNIIVPILKKLNLFQFVLRITTKKKTN